MGRSPKGIRAMIIHGAKLGRCARCGAKLESGRLHMCDSLHRKLRWARCLPYLALAMTVAFAYSVGVELNVPLLVAAGIGLVTFELIPAIKMRPGRRLAAMGVGAAAWIACMAWVAGRWAR